MAILISEHTLESEGDMKFEEILPALREGKAVRRGEWVKINQALKPVGVNEYLCVRLRTDIPRFGPMLVARLTDGSLSHYRPTDSQLFAEDWEIAE